MTSKQEEEENSFPPEFNQTWVNQNKTVVKYDGIDKAGKHVLRCTLCNVTTALQHGAKTSAFDNQHMKSKGHIQKVEDKAKVEANKARWGGRFGFSQQPAKKPRIETSSTSPTAAAAHASSSSSNPNLQPSSEFAPPPPPPSPVEPVKPCKGVGERGGSKIEDAGGTIRIHLILAGLQWSGGVKI